MSSRDASYAYRRGLVLGLTLAEVFLLLLFLLLLVFAYLLGREADLWDPVREVMAESGLPNETVEEIQNSVVVLAQRLDNYSEIREAYPDADAMVATLKAFDNVIERLRDEGVDVVDPESLKSRLTALSDADLLAREFENTCGALEEIKVLLEESFREETAQEALELCPPSREDADVDEKPQTLEQAEKVIARLRRTNSGLNETLTELSEGKGLVYPPCWANTLDPRRPQYIYDVTIVDDGVSVALGDSRDGQDRSVFDADASDPPFGKTLDRLEFLRSTRAMFDWSVDNQCRFFVRVIDGSSPENKDGYKRHLATVETHFYKYLVP